MKVTTLLFAAVLSLLAAPPAASAGGEIGANGEVAATDADGGSEDDEHYDLDSMTDEALEEICTSRGFELVREANAATGKPLEFTRQDYVDAASECLKIEADLEEMLRKHPERLEDVRREGERMERERDRLADELRRRNGTSGGAPAVKTGGGAAPAGTPAPPDRCVDGDGTSGKDDGLHYDLGEITREVVDQIKSDFAKVANFVLPEKVRETIRLQFKARIRPAFASAASVTRDMGWTALDMARRYLSAFVKGGAGEGRGTPEDDGKGDGG